MGMIEFKAKIKEIKDYDDGIKHTRVVSLSVPEDVNFNFETGQAAFLGHEEVKNINNPKMLKWGIYSIASSPNDLKEGNLDFCITSNSETGVSYYIAKKLNVDDEIIVKGPFGHYGLKEEYDHYYFVATGSGIAPYISMMRTLIAKGSKAKMTVFFGFRKALAYLYKDELEAYERSGQVELITTVSREDPTWKGRRGYVQQHILEHDFDENEKKCLYVCGAPAVLDAVKSAATEKGFKEEDIFIEKW
jgi:NAD(P)H-flavin reductase